MDKDIESLLKCIWEYSLANYEKAEVIKLLEYIYIASDIQKLLSKYDCYIQLI